MANQLTSRLPIWRQLARAGAALGGEWRPIEGPGPDLEPPSEPAAFGEVEIVEDGGVFGLHDVGSSDESRFRFFLDGIERARVVGYVGAVPIVHGYVGAVIRERTGRAFDTWGREEREVLAFPFEHLPAERLIGLGISPERFPDGPLLDSGADESPFHPLRLIERGRQAVKRAREHLEQRLAARWAKRSKPHPQDWLLVDGPLAVEPALLRTGRAIGLIKSHRTQFLEPEAMRGVLASPAGQRSSVFRPVRPDVGKVHSWYLRLRPPAGHDIYWALVRVEARAADESVNVASEVSRWLRHEIAPLALPDPRWDVLLYPIRDCESYLRARMPTLAAF